MAIKVISTKLQLALSQDAQITVQPTERPSHAPTVCGKSTLQAMVRSLPASILLLRLLNIPLGLMKSQGLEYSWSLSNEGVGGIIPLNNQKPKHSFTVGPLYVRFHILRFNHHMVLLMPACSAVSDSCDPMDYSPLCPSIHGIFQARMLEWVATSFSRRSSWSRDRTHISCVSCIGRWILYYWATWEAVVPGMHLLFTEKIHYKWTSSVQTCVVQGSTALHLFQL